MNLTDYQQFLLGIVSGSIPTLIGAYIAHRLSVKRSKERTLIPYLRELHGVVSRIMDNKQAEHFREAYEQLVETAVNEKVREDALKVMTKQTETTNMKFPHMSKTSYYYVVFFALCTEFIDVIKECQHFERIFAEMQKKGLTSTLTVHNKRLSGNIDMFHGSASYIVTETKDIVGRLESRLRTSDIFDSDFQEILQRMLRLNTHNLFTWGTDLKKQLEKLV